MNLNPYKNFPNTSYWKRSVSEKTFFDISELWVPKFKISMKDKFATYGSCFAQHFSNALRAKGIKWINSEPGPMFISEELKKEYNYGIYSSRTQNIYTPTMLLQWLKIVNNNFSSNEIWEDNGRFYDPLRPTVEPNGFATDSELFKARQITAKSFLSSIQNCTVFVFTLGLTERWINNTSQIEYAQCPGLCREV